MFIKWLINKMQNDMEKNINVDDIEPERVYPDKILKEQYEDLLYYYEKIKNDQRFGQM